MKADRFKFRAAVKISGYDPDGNDKEYNILIYGVAPYGGRDIGFGYDDFMTAVDNSGYSDEEKEKIVDQLENEQCWNDEWCNYWGGVEQCTGISDKNGKPIYENDLVRLGQKTGTVCWDNGGLWVVKTDKDTRYPIAPGAIFEIIGNIHEQGGAK